MKKWIYRILLVVCLCVFGYSAYNLWDIYSQKQQVENETKQLEKNVIKKKDKEEKQVLDPDWSKLKAENEDIVACVCVRAGWKKKSSKALLIKWKCRLLFVIGKISARPENVLTAEN